MDTRLLLLDINGVLCCKSEHKNALEEVTEDLTNCNLNEIKLEILKLSTYNVTLRPNYREFLEFCYENFSVGFFSSTTYPNANAILEKILTPEQKAKTILKWFRDHTHLDPDFGSNPEIVFHDTIKKLSDIFDNPIINGNRKFSPKNTLLCDDSEIKTRFNDPKNIVIFKGFKGDPEDKVLYEMINVLSKRFEEL